MPELIPGGVQPKDGVNIKKRVREIFKTKTRDEWTQLFKKVDACCEPVLSLTEALNDPLAIERGMVVEVDLLDGKKVRQLAGPIKFSETIPEYKTAGTSPGLHTKEVLLKLGYKEEEIDAFEKTGLFS
jgi:crotonobetainyl-CoA:carnitine CoA-transferase CaiB-like acyl-CoA transferase